MYSDFIEPTLDTNEWIFCVNDLQKVYHPGDPFNLFLDESKWIMAGVAVKRVSLFSGSRINVLFMESRFNFLISFQGL